MSQKKIMKEISPSERKRLHVAAMVTQEKEWPQSEPNQGLARMFVIMLLVHVVVIGGVIIYDFVAEPADAKITSTSTAKKTTTPATAPLPVVNDVIPAATPVPAPVTAITSTPPASIHVPTTAPAVKSPESLLPTGYTSTPITEKNPAPATPMLTAPLPPAPTPVAKVSTPVVQSELPAPPRAAIVTETSEKSSAPPPTKVKTPERQTEVKRAVLISSTTPKPVATPSQARRDLDNDNKRNTESKRSSDTAVSTTKKRAVESTPPAPAKKTTKPAAASTAGHHTVAKGETVYALARRYKVSEDAIIRANGIKNAGGLQIGKSLVIPAK